MNTSQSVLTLYEAAFFNLFFQNLNILGTKITIIIIDLFLVARRRRDFFGVFRCFQIDLTFKMSPKSSKFLISEPKILGFGSSESKHFSF